MAFGIIVSALTTRYRDLSVLIGFGVQLLMFATPVVYPLSSVPDAWRPFVALNSVVPIVEAFRFAFLGRGSVDPWMLATSAALIAVLLLLGLYLFHRVERTFMDTL
jgi:lipopolysaccharide transport system permease protein